MLHLFDGVFERVIDNKLEVAKVTFSVEPKKLEFEIKQKKR